MEGYSFARLPGHLGNRILLVAAGVTFYALLAIFPGIAGLISIYGLFADPASVASHLDTMANGARLRQHHFLRGLRAGLNGRSAVRLLLCSRSQ
jgi:hypothetical protein